MATVFISYKGEDQEIVNSLVPFLKEKGLKIRFDQELSIGAAWRDQLMGALLASDVDEKSRILVGSHPLCFCCNVR